MIRVKSTIKLRTGRDVSFLFMLERNQQGVVKLFAFLCTMRHCPLLRSAPNAIAGIYDTNDNHSHSSFLPVAGGNFEVLFCSCPQVSLVGSRKNFGGRRVLSHIGRPLQIILELEKWIIPSHNWSFLEWLYLCCLCSTTEQSGAVWDAVILSSCVVCVLLGFIGRASFPFYLM